MPIIVLSFIEQLFADANIHFDRETFAAAYAENIRIGQRAKGLPFQRPASGLKPADAVGWNRNALAQAQEAHAAFYRDIIRTFGIDPREAA